MAQNVYLEVLFMTTLRRVPTSAVEGAWRARVKLYHSEALGVSPYLRYNSHRSQGAVWEMTYLEMRLEHCPQRSQLALPVLLSKGKCASRKGTAKASVGRSLHPRAESLAWHAPDLWLTAMVTGHS